MANLYITTVALLAVQMFDMSLARSTGAPAEACISLFPTGHGVNATTPNPFMVTCQRLSYPYHEYVSVIIDGHDLPFKGALVQIRNSTDSAVGVYTNNAKGMKQSCGVTSATHESTTSKTMSILTFQVGAAVPGQILNCRATIVQSFFVFHTSSTFVV